MSRSNCGQSLIEVILALAIFSLIAAAMAVMVLGNSSVLVQAGQHTAAESLSQQGIEAVRAIRDQAWNELIYNQSSVSVSSSKWVFDGEGTTQLIDGFYTRTISIENVCRDNADEITTCPGSYTDLHSKKVISQVNWDIREGINNTVQQVSYFTNWDSSDWIQTDWAGGIGLSTTTQYESSDFLMNTNTIGQLSLKSDNIQDNKFDFPIDLNHSWSFDSWDVDGNEVIPIGAQNSSGGNLDGYVDITIPAGSDDNVGGYWQQPFTVYTDNPIGVNINFDYKVFAFNGTPDVADIRVYVDQTSGTPINQVGNSIGLSSEGAWNSAVAIYPSSAISTSGTYYLKIGLWVETPSSSPQNFSGPFTIGFDNLVMDLGNGLYPVSSTLFSNAFNMEDSSPVQLIDWDQSVSSTTAIKFKLRMAPDNSGLPGDWTDWYGSVGTSTFFTTASGTLASIDLNGGQWVQYKVELSGDGTKTPILEQVRINYK